MTGIFLHEPYGNQQQPQSGITSDYALPEGALTADRIFLEGMGCGGQDYAE